LAQWERALERGEPLPGQGAASRGIPDQQLSTMVNNTIAVMTQMGEKRVEWRETLAGALQQAQAGDRTQEIEFFTALLAILDGETPSLSPENPYAEALGAIQAGIVAGGAGVQQEDGIMAAIRAYLDAEDIVAMRQAVEKHQETLFQEQVAHIFQANVEQARRDGQQKAAERLAFHLGLLEACKTEGIAAAFARLEEAARAGQDQGAPADHTPGGSLPEDFVARSAAGIRGGSQEKQAAFNYLTGLATSIPQAGDLIQVVQLAILGQEPATLGQSLVGEYARTWKLICQAIAD